MECLLHCRKEYDVLLSLSDEGRLAEAVKTSSRLQGSLDAAPLTLTEAEVFSNLKVYLVQFNAEYGLVESFRLGFVQGRKRPCRRTAQRRVYDEFSTFQS